MRSPVRGGNEHRALNRGRWLEVGGALQQRQGVAIATLLLHRLVADLPPEVVFARHHHQLGEQPPLAVADHDHALQCRVAALGV